jgi:hypothetical protein
MTETTPSSTRKNRAWIWIVVAVLATGLVCLAVLGGAFAFAVWKGYIAFPGSNVRNLPSQNYPNQTSPSNPFRNTGPQATPGPAPSTLTVEPYQPAVTDRYPVLQQLVPDWKNPSAPVTNTYSLSLPYTQPVILSTGWCTSTQALLDQNLQHIQYIFEVDGKTVSMSQFAKSNQNSTNGFCQQTSGLIRAWPTGSHTIKIMMRVDEKINDGWNDYAAGDYVEEYKITTK